MISLRNSLSTVTISGVDVVDGTERNTSLKRDCHYRSSATVAASQFSYETPMQLTES
jgi:hypothetical protein